MKNKIRLLIIIIIFIGLVISCQALMKVADFGAQVAGAAGVIDKSTADVISSSARTIGTAAEEITPEQEYYIGRAVAANILNSNKIWNGNPALTTYLNQICMAIVINSPRPDIFNGYHVVILDSNDINAFATSGGHIFVTRGLINAAKSEDALAGVIAHEVAHIQLKHGIRAIRNSRITQALIDTGTQAAGAAGMNITQLTDVFNESVGEIIQTMVNSGYSQAQEFEADKTAMSLMASAGYNPSGLIDMLNALKSVQTSTSSGFGKTHPKPDDRISNARSAVSSYRVADTSRLRQARFAEATR